MEQGGKLQGCKGKLRKQVDRQRKNEGRLGEKDKLDEILYVGILVRECPNDRKRKNSLISFAHSSNFPKRVMKSAEVGNYVIKSRRARDHGA